MITFDGNTLTVGGAWLTDVDPLNNGAYELYQQVSQQPTVIDHGGMFTDCGIDTVTGLADCREYRRLTAG